MRCSPSSPNAVPRGSWSSSRRTPLPTPSTPATSLFVVWLFPNDVFYANTTGMLPGVVPGSPGGGNVIANGIANILTTIQILAAAGAQHFLVPNLANLADTPAFAGGPLADGLSD